VDLSVLIDSSSRISIQIAAGLTEKQEDHMSQRSFVTIATGLAMIAWCAVGAAAQDEGVKQIEQLIKKARAEVESINEAKQQLQKTMTAYNTVLSPDAKDRRDSYKQLQKEMATSEKRRAEVRSRHDEMKGEAEKLFASWQSSTAAIQSPELRQKSEARLTKSRERFAEIQTAGQGASDLYGPFMKTLQDQVTYLGHDLNPGAVSSLKPEADKLNASATELYAAIDKVTMAANNNISRLSAE
jgi:DNA repair exonuclease SbcCD ATPase subunit